MAGGWPGAGRWLPRLLLLALVLAALPVRPAAEPGSTDQEGRRARAAAYS